MNITDESLIESDRVAARLVSFGSLNAGHGNTKNELTELELLDLANRYRQLMAQRDWRTHLKPFEWVQSVGADATDDDLEAGDYLTYKSLAGVFHWIDPNYNHHPCVSLEEAKAQAWDHYVARMSKAFKD